MQAVSSYSLYSVFFIYLFILVRYRKTYVLNNTVLFQVGVGTCGVSGQGMTDYNPIKKHRKTNF